VGQEVRVDPGDLVDRVDPEVQEVQVARVDPGDQKQLLNQEQPQSPQVNLEALAVPEVQEVPVVQEVRVARVDQADQQLRGQVSVRPGSYHAFLPCQIQFNELHSTEIRCLNRLLHFCRKFDWPYRIIRQK